MSEAALFISFALQGLLMSADEIYFHRTREMRAWERIGHPLDTFGYGLCFAWLSFTLPSRNGFWIYLVLGVISCLLITKDEWQHKELCSGLENWLHALLFMLHPVILICAGVYWWSGRSPTGLRLILGCVTLFFLYQLIYWNVWRRDRQRIL